MKLYASVLVAAFLVAGVCPVSLAQQGSALHAPDFRAQDKIAPLYFPPKTNAPFMAIARTLWVRTLPDGSTLTTQNERVVARDSDGRIFQERRTFIPVPAVQDKQSVAYMNVFSDPAKHTLYNCIVVAKVCYLGPYYDRINQPERPAGLQPDKMTYLTRENLGVDTFQGLEVQRSRETFTFFSQTIGNTSTILRTVDYWYSPELGVNVQVKRHDPRDGDQTLWLTDITETSAAPEAFQVPAGYRIIDQRASRPSSPPAGEPLPPIGAPMPQVPYMPRHQ